MDLVNLFTNLWIIELAFFGLYIHIHAYYFEIPCFSLIHLLALPSHIYVFLDAIQDSFYRGLTAEESKRVSEYNFDHPGVLGKVIIQLFFAFV